MTGGGEAERSRNRGGPVQEAARAGRFLASVLTTGGASVLPGLDLQQAVTWYNGSISLHAPWRHHHLVLCHIKVKHSVKGNDSAVPLVWFQHSFDWIQEKYLKK